MEATENKIKLGYTVKDAVTGFTGIAMMSIETLTGTKQYYVQPKCKAGEESTMPIDVSFDWQRLDVVDTGVSDRYAEVKDDTGFTLGEEVQSLVSGFRGIIIHKYVSLNGCIRFMVQSQIASRDSSNEKFVPRESITDHKELRHVTKGVSEMVKSEATGGPAIKAPQSHQRPR